MVVIGNRLHSSTGNNNNNYYKLKSLSSIFLLHYYVAVCIGINLLLILTPVSGETSCDAGSVLSGSSCVSCTSGQYQDENDVASTVCLTCGLSLTSIDSSTGCTACINGQYQDQAPAVTYQACKTCSIGQAAADDP